MKTIFLTVFIITQIFSQIDSFVIPDEVPSFLSVIYSNIPTIKKGTDSRFGWGFRLGDRADFQVLTELGPQTNTRPLANQGDSSSGASKRDSVNNLSDILYAQRLREKQLRQTKKENEDKSEIVTEEGSDGAKWLRTWSQGFKKIEKPQHFQELVPKPGLAVGEIDAKSVIPEDTQ